MPVDVTEPITPPASDTAPRKRWTRKECELLDAMGVWNGQRLELIDGELIDKRMPKNPPHILAVILLHEWLAAIFGFLRVRKEDPIDVATADNATSEPEPDLVVLRESARHFPNANPSPQDVELIVEVSESTLFFDLNKKAPIYARAGIPEYWVLDINLRRLIVHREPLDGKYHSVKIYHQDERVSPLAAPGSEFRVAQAFED